MSEPKLVSPLLDGFIVGEPISDHHGVRCCPAIREDTDERYIVKIISIPATQVQVDALLLTGACSDSQQALAYFKDLSDSVAGEADILERLSQLEGFSAYLGCQIQQMEEGIGYEIYLISPYRYSLERLMRSEPLTHLKAVNMGLDICAALTACRRAGYLYADLKPENIFLSETQGYHIGDLGFIPMASLKYAALPEKYRSSYTAPEIEDAMSALNDTMDIYALGLVLYQVYNSGQLPFDGNAPSVVLPSPMYADYEMAEIILKACAPDPADRWQDPAQMGQALVNYMQRNSINDTPIIPAPVVIEEQEKEPEGFISEEQNEEDLAQLLAMIPDEVPPEQLSLEPISEETIEEKPVSEEEPEQMTDDTAEAVTETEQLSFLDEDDLHESGVTNEVAQMLAQADDLISHELPEPVVAPAPIDVPIPAPIVEEPETEAPAEEDPAVAVTAEESGEITEEIESEEHSEDLPAEQHEKKPVRRWITAAIVLLLLIAAGIGGYIWYQEYYIQTVESFEIHYISDQLHIEIRSDINDALLTAVCTDTYGNSKRCSVTDGKAVFSDLNPGTQYRVRLEISGLHKLEGPSSGTYTTAEQTQILNFSAQCGPEDGSVILSFVVVGPDCDQWTVSYGTSGQEPKTQDFSGHRVTLYDLSIGSDYTIRLLPAGDMILSGTYELTYTAQSILYAQNLTITACNNNALTAQWQQPEGVTVEKWTVRCFNNSGFDQTITTENTAITFTDLDHTAGYTIQVTAQGMQEGVSATVCADPLNVDAYTITPKSAGYLEVIWTFTGTTPETGWLLQYRIDGGEAVAVACSEARAEILLVPDGMYEITLTPADNRNCFGGACTYGPAEITAFSGYGVTAADLTLSTVLRPSKANWSHKDLSPEDYKSIFVVGENASILAHCSTTYGVSTDTIVTTYVVRDSQNRLVSTDTQSRAWRNMWYQRYCELDLPTMPAQSGAYTVDIYFNDMYVSSLEFTITE